MTTKAPAFEAVAHQHPTDARDLWVHRRATAVSFRDRLALYALIAAGLAAVLRLADWWFRAVHVAQPLLFVLLSLAFWYAMSRLVLGWIAYAGLRHPVHRAAPAGKRVAIFTTSSPGEPFEMFEKTLAACARVVYPHITYLLDDTRDPRFAQLAARHGAVHLELVGLAGAKAGKINRALERTDEEFILVLDPDHVPFPLFLDRVLGHFDDPKVGFVQVSQAYYNQPRSFVARGAAEQTYGFYGPTLSGLYGHGCSVAIGANCVFRRSALQSIGGHGIGLAEDLVTAIRLHAAGWRSVYVPEVVSRGLVPEDLDSFYRQQLKWARGVFEVLFAELPALFGRLTWRQRLAYAAIGTHYLFGVTSLLFLLFPYLYLWTGVQPASMRFEEFLLVGGPVALFGVAIYLLAQRWLCHRAIERGLHWRGLVLKVACWPVFVTGTLVAIFRADIPYVPTRKRAVRSPFLRLAWPHLVLLGLYLHTLGWTLQQRIVRVDEAALRLTSEATWGMIAFASVPVLVLLGAIRAAVLARRPPAGDPWDAVPPSLTT